MQGKILIDNPKFAIETSHLLQARNDEMRKEQIRQQAYNRQKAQFSQVLSSLSAEERLKLSRLSKDEQVTHACKLGLFITATDLRRLDSHQIDFQG